MHGTTLTLHIHRHITEDGSILLDVGKRIFRLYERSGVALELGGRKSLSPDPRS